MGSSILNQKSIIAVIENTELQSSINDLLLNAEYKVILSLSSEEILEYSKKESSDLIIVNFFSPAMTLNFCKAVKNNLLTCDIAILAIVNEEELFIKDNALFMTIDDFIKKPFCAEELLARIKTVLWRVHCYRDINPLTNLRGTSTAIKELYRRIGEEDKFAAVYTDLYNFKKFNKRYGFKRGDEVITHTGTLIYKIIADLGNPSDALFHFGNDTFFLIVCLDAFKDISVKIIEDFDNTISSFYDEEDKKQGYIMVKSRDGKISKTPFLKIHMGIVTTENYPLTSPTQIIHVAIELKNYADNFEKSIYIIERRKM